MSIPVKNQLERRKNNFMGKRVLLISLLMFQVAPSW